MRSTNEGHTWEIVSPTDRGAPAQPISLDPVLYLDKDTDRVFTNNIPPDVTCQPISFSDDAGRGVDDDCDLRSLRPPEHLHRTAARGRRPALGIPERGLLLRDQPRHVVGYLDRNDMRSFTGWRHDVAADGRARLHHSDPAPGKSRTDTWCDGAVGHGFVGTGRDRLSATRVVRAAVRLDQQGRGSHVGPGSGGGQRGDSRTRPALRPTRRATSITHGSRGRSAVPRRSRMMAASRGRRR